MNRLRLCVLPAVMLLAAPPASADGQEVAQADLMGSVPDVVIRGLLSGSAPWAVEGGPGSMPQAACGSGAGAC